MAGAFGSPTGTAPAGGMSPNAMKSTIAAGPSRTPRPTPAMPAAGGVKGPAPMAGNPQAQQMQSRLASAKAGAGLGTGAMAPQTGGPQAQQMQQWLASRQAAPQVGTMPSMTANKGLAAIASPPIR